MKWCSGVAILCALLLNSNAQQNRNLPHIIQATGDLGFLPSGITAGHWWVGHICWESDVVPTACTSITDTNGIIPSFTLGSLAYTNAGGISGGCTGNIFDTYCASQFYWGKATSSGVPAISAACTLPRQNIGTAVELSGNVVPDVQAMNVVSNANTFISLTTTANNDFIVNGICNGWQPETTAIEPQPTNNFAESAQTFELGIQDALLQAGNAGVNTANWFNQAVFQLIGAVAFKPTGIFIGTSALPQAGNGSPYYAKLVGYGGNPATYAWSIISGTLTPGLTLNGASGEITGTPSNTVGGALTFQLTDGTLTTTSIILVPVGLPMKTLGTPSCSGFDTNPNLASLSGINVGDTLLWFFVGDDRHGIDAHQLTENLYSDNCGDFYTRWSLPIGGGQSGNMQVISTQALCGGTINPTYSGVGGSPLSGEFCVVPNGQAQMDPSVINQAIPGNVTSSTLTSSITTKVPNSIVMVSSALDCLATGGGSCTMSTSTNAPWILLGCHTGFGGMPFCTYYELASTVGTYSATSNYSDSTNANMFNDTTQQVMITIRPAPPPSAGLSGEKKRRAMN